MPTIKIIFYLLSLLAALNIASAQTMFKVVPVHADTKVQFTSKAATETVVGTTRTATGFIEFDPLSTGEEARGEIHVDLTSIKTGIELRDRHMRENHLETSRYPEAVFTVTSLTLPVGGLKNGESTRVTVQGTLSLHGVEHSIEPETYMTIRNNASGSAISIESSFPVKLADYSIKRPQFLLLRLSEVQRMHVELHAVSSTRVAERTQ